jgi:hypothetical protein
VGRDPLDGVGIERVLHEVDGAVAQLQCAHQAVGDDAELDRRQRRGTEREPFEALETDHAVLRVVRHAVRPCADEVRRGEGGRMREARGQHRDRRRFEERRVRLAQVEHDLVWRGRLY